MLNHKRENEVTRMTSAVQQSPYLKAKTIAQIWKHCQDLTKGGDRSLNPDTRAITNERMRGAPVESPSGCRHDQHNDQEACCSQKPGARCRHCRALPQSSQRPFRFLSAGAPLHARPRAQMARQA